ncbi:MAG: hypothetical protein K2X37_14355 [Chitinophagaceae bacterium]|nr:hypothetical protein [Chitinophagaceae bacterium]
MPLVKVTANRTAISNGVRLEKGMTAQVVTKNSSSPFVENGGLAVAEAFQRVYGFDLKKTGLLSSTYFDVIKIS